MINLGFYMLLLLVPFFSEPLPVGEPNRFQLCAVEPASDLLAEIPYGEAIQRVTISGPEGMETGESKKQLEDYADRDYQLVLAEAHPFAYAVQKAYAEHRPLVISPDMIWLMIMQGFAQHVDNNSEELRDLFVDFDGKKMLNVKRRNFVKGSPDNDWEGVFPEFSQQIDRYTKEGLEDMINQSFTTSTEVERTAFRITVMDAMSAYFHYSFTVSCGIPEIILEGTPEDWAKIETQAKELSNYQLGWWTEALQPILNEFTLAANGTFNRDFWVKIYDERQAEVDLVCAKAIDTYITGWMLDFFPYVRGEKNPFLGNKRADSDIEMHDLSSGLSRADMLYDDFGTFYKMELVSGFVGIRQDAVTKSLRPEISWAIVDTGDAPSGELLEAYLEFKRLEAMQAAVDQTGN